jgi:hypothetical protein
LGERWWLNQSLREGAGGKQELFQNVRGWHPSFLGEGAVVQKRVNTQLLTPCSGLLVLPFVSHHDDTVMTQGMELGLLREVTRTETWS